MVIRNDIHDVVLQNKKFSSSSSFSLLKQQQKPRHRRKHYYIQILTCSIISITLYIPIFYTNHHIIIIPSSPQKQQLHHISNFRDSSSLSHHLEYVISTKIKLYPKIVILLDNDDDLNMSSSSFKITMPTKHVRNVLNILVDNDHNRTLKFYNNLTIHFNFIMNKSTVLSSSSLYYKRYINPNDENMFDQERFNLLHQLDKPYIDKWYANTYDDYDYHNVCVRPLWSYSYYPSCNDFHNSFDSTLYNYYLDNDDDNSSITTFSTSKIVSFLGEGFYRQSWSFISNQYNNETLVMKHFRLNNEKLVYNIENFEKIKMEALLSMEMSSSNSKLSNHIISIYGHCGYSTIVEYGYDISHQIIPRPRQDQIGRGRIKQDVLNQLEKEKNPYPMNHLSVDEKLNIAISMVSSLSELHGFKYGTVVHQDVHPDQWLQTIDGRIVLNDMNNAEFLRWNYTSHNYCQYQCYYDGPFHSPEEYLNNYIDESADIYPIGNLLFSIITGLYPYYTEYKHKIIQNYILNEISPYYNPLYNNHSYIEYQMLHIMKLCYQRNSINRINIFQIIQLLKDIKYNNKSYDYKSSN